MNLDDIINSIDIDEIKDASSFLREVKEKQQQAGIKSKINFTNEHDDDDEIETIQKIDSNETLKIVVKQLIQIEDELTELNSISKIKRQLKTALRKQIVDYMEKEEALCLNLGKKGCFKLKKNTKKINPFTQKRLPIFIADYFERVEKLSKEKAELKRNELLNFIRENAQKEEYSSLRRFK